MWRMLKRFLQGGGAVLLKVLYMRYAVEFH